ncbi:hypothetical protein AB1K70_03365 [Bremerella sp. JC770]|uniref:hypothetical protein n=1 Tax=Bremerella sp. JC770 TaxID=3232137 RepID=UPI00345A687B
MSNTNSLVAVNFSTIESTQQSINDIHEQFGDKAKIVFRQDESGHLYATKLKWRRLLHFDYANNKAAKRFESMFGPEAKDLTELMHRRWFGFGPLSWVKKAVSKDVLTRKLQKLIHEHPDGQLHYQPDSSSPFLEVPSTTQQDNNVPDCTVTDADQPEEAVESQQPHTAEPQQPITQDALTILAKRCQAKRPQTPWSTRQDARNQLESSLRQILSFPDQPSYQHDLVISEVNKTIASYNSHIDFVEAWCHGAGKADRPSGIQPEHLISTDPIVLLKWDINNNKVRKMILDPDLVLQRLAVPDRRILAEHYKMLEAAKALGDYLQAFGRDAEAKQCQRFAVCLSALLTSQQTQITYPICLEIPRNIRPNIPNEVLDTMQTAEHSAANALRQLAYGRVSKPQSLAEIAILLDIDPAVVSAFASSCNSDFGVRLETSIREPHEGERTTLEGS